MFIWIRSKSTYFFYCRENITSKFLVKLQKSVRFDPFSIDLILRLSTMVTRLFAIAMALVRVVIIMVIVMIVVVVTFTFTFQHCLAFLAISIIVIFVVLVAFVLIALLVAIVIRFLMVVPPFVSVTLSTFT